MDQIGGWGEQGMGGPLYLSEFSNSINSNTVSEIDRQSENQGNPNFQNCGNF